MPDFAQADIDLAIRFGPGDYDRAHSELLASESVMPMLAPGLATTGEPWHRQALIHDDSPDRDPACPSWAAWFAANGLSLPEGRGGLRVNRSSLALDAAVAGHGVVLGKQTLAGPDLAAGRLVLAPGVQPVRLGFGYWMVWPRGRTLSAGLKAFMVWLRDEAGTQDIDVGGGI
jgi:LysR family glycine cleavage system transcriptional activator